MESLRVAETLGHAQDRIEMLGAIALSALTSMAEIAKVRHEYLDGHATADDLDAAVIDSHIIQIGEL